jgi:hypothetical protein
MGAATPMLIPTFSVLRNDIFYTLCAIQLHWHAFIRLIILVFFFPFLNDALV